MHSVQLWHAAAVVLLAAGSLVFSGCDSGGPAVAEQPVPKVTVTKVVVQETIDADEYTGKTEASESVEVRSRVFGHLKTIEFVDGDFVTEGQTLFTIEPDEYEAIHKQSLSRIDLTKANLDLAKAKHARNEKLIKSNSVSREDYEESAAAVEAADASTKAAQADANRTAVDLKYTEIKAPISGRIDRALVSKGNLLTGGQSSGTLLTKIVREQPMYAYFDVDERSLLGYMRQRDESRAQKPGSLRELGMACYLQLADEDDFPHEGVLDFASAEVDAGTGTARIRGVFTNENRELASGLFVRVRVPVSEPYEALLIPERALATDQSIKFVYVIGKDGAAERRTVELGPQRGEMRIITKGLEAGEQVIVKGLQRVRPGQKVEAEVAAMPPLEELKPTTMHKPATDATALENLPSATPAEEASRGGEAEATPPEPVTRQPVPAESAPAETAPAESAPAEDGATSLPASETAADEKAAPKAPAAPRKKKF